MILCLEIYKIFWFILEKRWVNTEVTSVKTTVERSNTIWFLKSKYAKRLKKKEMIYVGG